MARKIFYLMIVLLLFNRAFAESSPPEEIKGIALSAKKEVETYFEKVIDSGKVSLGEIFSTFYIPIPEANPPKYHTVYDRKIEADLQIILDKHLDKSTKLDYVVAVDREGYAPTHNSIYCKPPGRDKMLYNDQIGMKVNRSQSPVLQKYFRDNGDVLYDYAVQIYVKEKRWGALRVGFSN
ncbi:MAG: chemotaxis protein [Desulfobacteraceae bacterium]|nr:chemotaxis protein [Desulfobacteraceae bacterium]